MRTKSSFSTLRKACWERIFCPSSAPTAKPNRDRFDLVKEVRKEMQKQVNTVGDMIELLKTYDPNAKLWVEVKGKCLRGEHILTRVSMCEDKMFRLKSNTPDFEWEELEGVHSTVAIISAQTADDHKCLICQ